MKIHCLFCKIIAAFFLSAKVYRTSRMLSATSILQTPTHIVVRKRAHRLRRGADGGKLDSPRVAVAVAKIAEREARPAATASYPNVGSDAGQTVKHLHFHVLGASVWTTPWCKG